MKYTLLFFFLSLHYYSFSQSPDVTRDISAVVFLDSFVVSAKKQGFNVADFIDIVQEDESLFRAFHNLRFQPHTADNQIEILNRKQEVKASNYHRIEQIMQENCRTMKYLEEEIKGKFYKKKKSVVNLPILICSNKTSLLTPFFFVLTESM